MIGLPPTGALALPGRWTRTAAAVPSGDHTAAHGAVERSRNGVGAGGGSVEPVTARLLDLLVEARDLQDVLDAVAGLAVELVSRCESASITLIRGSAPYTAASSDGPAAHLDEAQYRLGEGPCLHAAQNDEPVQIDDVAGPGATGAWVRAAHEIGITASLSMPIAAGAGIAAALNLYTSGGIGWSQADLDAAESLATYAGDAIVIASRLTTPASTAR